MQQQQDFEQRLATVAVATADADDPLCGVQDILRLAREEFGLEVAFVSQFADGRRIFRVVDNADDARLVTVGDSDELEASWCQRVVDGRLPRFIANGQDYVAAGRAPAAPFSVGTHLSVPIVQDDGTVYGTVCCFSRDEIAGVSLRDVQRLSRVADLLAGRFAAH